MATNHEVVDKGFRALLAVLAPYVAAELESEYREDWWKTGVIDKLYDDQKRNLPLSGDRDALVDSLDIQRTLLLLDVHWQQIFRKKLSLDHRNWTKELIGVRNKLAHLGGKDFRRDDAWRALDTMARLCEQLDAERTEEIRSLLRDYLYGSESVSAPTPAGPSRRNPERNGLFSQAWPGGLPGWREMIEPHPDVAQGRYRKAEFAADLAQVARGEGALEYQDPVEFFRRTFITEGMAGLLQQALLRTSGRGGEPVVQLKTAFGGGKTHSMLALYHLLRGSVSLEKLPDVRSVVEAAGLASLPKARVAVLVGPALDPSKSRRPPNLPGVTVNTLWGEMAAQFARSAGKPRLYDFVREADKKGVSPGSEALRNLFDACGPCLVLLDEIVAYARRLHGIAGLPAGSFDNCVSFIQEISEAARASKNSLVVAAIPESDLEIGGEAGRIALATIEHTFGRMEAVWKPVAAAEGFEVVRRRLFLDCKDPDGRDRVCAAFSRLYAENTADFPREARELAYRDRLLACYPVHPEVFDRLYDDWAALERFQRTRGVLRLMAAVIHELWMNNDPGLLILPGSLPLDAPPVKDELTRNLPQTWNTVVDSEVDGKRSIPYRTDQENQRYGKKMAARRVARAIMLGSAPASSSQSVRGIESSRIRLGVVQPGDGIADYNDALSSLQSSLHYLYANSSGNRFWYDTRPTLKKLVEDRSRQISDSDAEGEIETRLRSRRSAPPFAGIHSCPASSLDVPDEQSARLVILRPASAYQAAEADNPAVLAVNDFLGNRGNSPRIYRNMLAFLAPDRELLRPLLEETRIYLAWRSIKSDSENLSLNLDTGQIREVESGFKRSGETVDERLRETWCWLLLPRVDREADLKTVQWDRTRLGGGDEMAARAAKKMRQDETILDKWAPALLRLLLDEILWRDLEAIPIKQLWTCLTSYCYLPRLADFSVLQATIVEGLPFKEYFAYAAGRTDNRFLDLKFNQAVLGVDPSGYLVKPEIAERQLRETAIPSGAIESTPIGGGTQSGSDGSQKTGPIMPKSVAAPPPAPRNRHFYMSAGLDPTRINRDVQKLVEEVISQLANSPGAQLEITLEVDAKSTDGFPVETVRTVVENCRTLSITKCGFDEG